MTYRPEVVQLAEPFPTRFIHDDGRGNEYVPHHIVRQRLIQIFGVPPKIEILRELYDDTEQGKKLTGVVMRLTVPGLESVEETGEADNPQSKTNGARAKDACSDAIKRCAMSLGCGLHLWAQKDYYLFDLLSPKGGEVSGAGTDNEGGETGGRGSASEAPAPAPENKSGSADTSSTDEAEPQSEEESRSISSSDSPIPPATDLVEVHGKAKVLAVARRVAKKNATKQPTSIEEISHPLAILVGQDFEREEKTNA